MASFTRLAVVAIPLTLLALGCGNEGGGAASAGADAEAGEDETAASTGATTTASVTATASATQDGTADSTSAPDESGDAGLPKLDVGAFGDVGRPAGCGVEGGDVEFSYAWPANTGENTVSKINTLTVMEEGRYLTQPAGVSGGSPSRTSVNLNGAVAVANRGDSGTPGASGITVIAAREEDCIDHDGDGTITTSSGFGDVLPWGEDECVLWHTPFDEVSNRPVAWTSGTLNRDTCKWEGADVWTGTSVGNPADTTQAHVYLLDGETGEIEQEVLIAGWCEGDARTLYGGAVDSNNDFWFVGAYTNCVGHVSYDDLSYEVIVGGSTPYGMIVDSKDRVWKANGTMSRYDPATATWMQASCNQGCTALAQGPDGGIWVGGAGSTPYTVFHVDPETMVVLGGWSPAELPGLDMPWGLSFDAEGYLWAIEMGNQVYKIDIETGEHWIFDNSAFMYTYSDFTGYGLSNVAGAGPG
jgi:hypothetical protein